MRLTKTEIRLLEVIGDISMIKGDPGQSVGYPQAIRALKGVYQRSYYPGRPLRPQKTAVTDRALEGLVTKGLVANLGSDLCLTDAGERRYLARARLALRARYIRKLEDLTSEVHGFLPLSS